MAVANDLLMPKLGLTMTEGVLAEWQVAPGDRVSAGQVLFVVETDKLANEVEASGEGEILELVADAGATLPVGAVVARWTGEGAGDGSDAAAPAVADAELAAATPAPSPVAPAAATPRADGQRLVATPLARRTARLKGVDLAQVAGTGAGGRIKARDVEGATAAPEAEAKPAPAPAVSRVAATPLQATVARRLGAAKRDIPHFYLAAEADVGRLLALRTELNAEPGRARLSVNHFILAAVARVWAETPEANRLWEEDGFVALATVDVGVAVDTPRGLYAPVVRDAGSLDLDRLGAAADAVAARARDGRLGADDLAGGAVTVSNVGMHDVTYLTPIINPGQSAILGVGTVRSVFRPDEQERPVLRRELGLVLACDHRVFNGVTAARLLGGIVGYLEAPLRLLRAREAKG